MKYIVFTISCALVYRILKNLSCWIQIMYYHKKYLSFLNGSQNSFLESVAPVRRLFEEAGLSDRCLPYIEQFEGGYTYQAEIYVFENIGTKQKEIISNVQRCFYEASGVFKSRLIESFSPIYWVPKLVDFLKSLKNDDQDTPQKEQQKLWKLLTAIVILLCEILEGR